MTGGGWAWGVAIREGLSEGVKLLLGTQDKAPAFPLEDHRMDTQQHKSDTHSEAEPEHILLGDLPSLAFSSAQFKH